MAKPAKRLKVGATVSFGDGRLTATVEEELEHGGRIVRFYYQGIFLEVLESLGEMPLPPYIHEKLADRERYQTVYAKENGSAAAPTAGLHFTQELLQKIEAKGVHLVYLTLHVGLGTFRPVSVDNLEDHEMHSEFYQLSEEAAATLRQVKAAGKRIVAVGTTSIRTLETIGNKFDGDIQADSGWTNIFIKPGYEWKVVDAFSTNFHLPKSTLVMLVSAFAGRELTLEAYHHAIQERYRFFSFRGCYVHQVKESLMNKIESRHRLIRSIISERRIHTQQELQEALEANGVLVTQSTLSRDVKSLNLVKINEGDSSYYAMNTIAPSRWEKRLRMYMEDALVMLRPVQNQVVIKLFQVLPNPLERS